jgi:Holliday junction resolvase RusA-like endonuclease
MTPSVAFFVPGVPIPQGSMKAFVVAGRARVTSDNPKLRSWRLDVKCEAQKHWDTPTTEAVRVQLVFRFPRPKGHYGTGRNAGQVRASAPGYHTVKPDVDKLVRGCLDALTGVIWRDDSQVAGVDAFKEYGDSPFPEGTSVFVEVLNDE